jgi:hypothetical protein
VTQVVREFGEFGVPETHPGLRRPRWKKTGRDLSISRRKSPVHFVENLLVFIAQVFAFHHREAAPGVGIDVLGERVLDCVRAAHPNRWHGPTGKQRFLSYLQLLIVSGQFHGSCSVAGHEPEQIHGAFAAE